jgi:hypothetical protein
MASKCHGKIKKSILDTSQILLNHKWRKTIWFVFDEKESSSPVLWCHPNNQPINFAIDHGDWTTAGDLLFLCFEVFCLESWCIAACDNDTSYGIDNKNRCCWNRTNPLWLLPSNKQNPKNFVVDLEPALNLGCRC